MARDFAFRHGERHDQYLGNHKIGPHSVRVESGGTYTDEKGRPGYFWSVGPDYDATDKGPHTSSGAALRLAHKAIKKGDLSRSPVAWTKQED